MCYSPALTTTDSSEMRLGSSVFGGKHKHSSEGDSFAMPTLENQPEWVKSSLSFANGNCVEVASLDGNEIGVRNSRDAHGAVLRFTPDEWHAFLGGVRNGEFDRFIR
jgi:hypothetical protein